MSPRGRPRKRAANLPPHIDAAKLPAGIYWHPQRRFWYVKEPRPGLAAGSKRVAGPDARMSDLHALIEARSGVDRSALSWLCGEFGKSDQHAALSPATRADYDYCRRVLCEHPTRAGKLGTLPASKLTRPFVQRLVDQIAAGTDGKRTPSKAAHVRRYLSRVWEWGANRGHVPAENPAAGIDMPGERKQRRLPTAEVMSALVEFAKARGAVGAGVKGAVPPYLWAAAELAYLCRLRGIEVATLTDAHAEAAGVMSNRRKGSRDNVTRWSPRLRAAWDALAKYRAERWAAKATPIPIRLDQRVLIVSQSGQPIAKSSIDTAWQRLMHLAIAEGVIDAADRFALHDLKRRGITDTEGTRADKQEASGHRSASMMDVYDKSKPVVNPAGGPDFSTAFSTDNKKGPTGDG